VTLRDGEELSETVAEEVGDSDVERDPVTDGVIEEVTLGDTDLEKDEDGV